MKSMLVFLFLFSFLLQSECVKGTYEQKNKRKVINPDGKSLAGRPYSPAIEWGKNLFVSGQIALDPSTGKLVDGGIETQTRQALTNLKRIIEHAGYSMEKVVKCTVLLTDIGNYTTVNQIYMEFFPEDPPARVAFAVKDLPMNALIEIDAIAVK